MTMTTRKNRYVSTENIVKRDIADEIILVPIRGKVADMQRIYALDPVADFIWERLDGRQSVGDIHAAVVRNFDVPAEQAYQDLIEFIEEIMDANLVKEVT